MWSCWLPEGFLCPWELCWRYPLRSAGTRVLGLDITPDCWNIAAAAYGPTELISIHYLIIPIEANRLCFVDLRLIDGSIVGCFNLPETDTLIVDIRVPFFAPKGLPFNFLEEWSVSRLWASAHRRTKVVVAIIEYTLSSAVFVRCRWSTVSTA